MASEDIDLEDVPPEALVLRGGDFHGSSHLKNLRKVHEAYGVWGICAVSEPGKSAEELAAYGSYGGRAFMVTRAGAIQERNARVVREPKRPWPFALIVFPDEPDIEDWNLLQAIMEESQPVDNPTYKGK